jgi:hypothetical protein
MEPSVAKVKYTLLLPMYYNDGSQVPRSVLRRMCNEVFDFADGFGLAGKVMGAYRMKDGSKKMDRSIVVWIGIFESQEDILRRTVGKFARELGQESLYLERTGGTIEFIPPLAPEDES